MIFRRVQGIKCVEDAPGDVLLPTGILPYAGTKAHVAIGRDIGEDGQDSPPIICWPFWRGPFRAALGRKVA